ncbi:D-glycero-alpha-D-manno-heptose-1,7-bisphosphate 7-phosphatase [Hufsiella ginkgonis]|uniref:D,D-heptose 1,7-bisphosphate phosphatase n=1 Tax=Hufsiella ginkgonis TaxID=2695274 RepID=A0A7K1Y0R1_9SPHI|nr:HAD family hydrolase [Hufsiella ginkgonis]MXV16678.1 HAD-IIIA family hydrolase [Hufsiella ginkgonis]
MQRAIFIDKDGTLIPDIPYNVDPALITLSENCVEGLQKLQDSGFLLIIVSNQPGVALNYFSESALLCSFDKVRSLLSDQGITLEGIEYCPHHPQGTQLYYAKSCYCRKPLPGLLYRAAQRYGIDLSRSWMIGDILNDVEAGHRAGCKSILIINGNETEWKPGPFRIPCYVSTTINQAAEIITDTLKYYDQ